MDIIKNPTQQDIALLLAKSKSKTLRVIRTESGNYFWPAEQGTHREGAQTLQIPYNLPPGAGEIAIFD